MAVKESISERPRTGGAPVAKPVLKVTTYDQLSAGLISVVMGLALGVLCVFAWWYSTRPPRQEFLVPLEIVATGGGFEDGAPNESLNVESPEDPADNPTPDAVEDLDVTEALQTLAQFSDKEVMQFDQAQSDSSDQSGTPGSASGTGRRGLGSGPGNGGGIPNEQRWLIQYANESSLTEYAKQLDYFGIELGALMPNGELIYLSRVSTDSPVKRIATTGKGEDRLYMTWQGGTRKAADVKLFQKIGVDVSRAQQLFHFFPKATEQLLLTQELQAAKRSVINIKRTYFSVVPQGNGYGLVVVRQVFLR